MRFIGLFAQTWLNVLLERLVGSPRHGFAAPLLLIGTLFLVGCGKDKEPTDSGRAGNGGRSGAAGASGNGGRSGAAGTSGRGGVGGANTAGEAGESSSDAGDGGEGNSAGGTGEAGAGGDDSGTGGTGGTEAGAGGDDSGTGGTSGAGGTGGTTGGTSSGGSTSSGGNAGFGGSAGLGGNAGIGGTGTGGSAGLAGTGGDGTAGIGGAGAGGSAGSAGTAGTGGSSPGAITLSVKANPDPVVAGGRIFYEYKLTNSGGSTLTNVVLTQQTQNAATAYPGSSTSGAACGGSGTCGPGAIVTWPAFTLAAGQTQTVWMASIAAGNATDGTVIHSTVNVNYPGGNTVSKNIDVLVDSTAGLRLGITEDHNPVKAGDQLTYTLALGNTASQALPLSTAGVLTATLPSGTTFVSASAGGTSSNGSVQWNVGSLNPGTTQRYTYTVTVDSLADGTVLQPLAQILDGATSVVRATSLTEVRASVPLKMAMIANPDPIEVGGRAFYQFKITNTTAGTLTNVTLTEQTQNDATSYPGSSTAGAACGGSGTCGPGVLVNWPAFTLAAGQTQTIWVAKIVGSTLGTLVRNQAMLSYSGGAVFTALDLAIAPAAGLHLGITEDHNPVKSGDQLTYTLALGNTASQALPLSTAGVLTATLPPGTTFVSASAGGTSANGSVQWNVGSINPGATQHYTYTVTIGSLADGTVLQPFAQILDGASSVVRATSLTEVRASVPLKMTMIANPDPVEAGGRAFYQFKITNTSGGTLTNVTLTEQTQNDATSYPGSSTAGAACGGSGTCGPGVLVSWPAFTLAAGQTQTIWVAKIVGSTLGTLVRNQAMLSYSGGAVFTALDLTIAPAAGLHLGITEDHNPVKSGDQLTYTLALGNTASQALPLSTAGVLTATLPPGTTFVSASAGGTSANGSVQWNVGSINPGATQHYTYTVTIGSLADGTVLQPFAQILDGASSVVRATSLTEVRASVPLKMTMIVNPDPVEAGGRAFYQFKITNTSGGTLTNVTLTEQTQNDATSYPGSSTAGAACGGSGTCGPGVLVSWPAFTLAAGQTQTIWVAKIVGSTLGTLVRNQAMLSYSGGAVLSVLDLTIAPAAGLHLGMTEDRNPAKAGEQLTYTLTLGNTASQALPLSTAGVLTASLPPGTTFVSASGGGTSANGRVLWNVGAVNPGATQRYTFTVSVDGSLADGTLLSSLAQLMDSATSVVRATTSTEVRATVPLSLALTISPDPVAPSGLVTYTYVITNTSGGTLTNVTLIEQTRNSATTSIASSTGSPACGGSGTCGPGVLVSWPAFTLTSGQTQTVSLTSQVAGGAPNGTLFHTQAALNYTGGTILRDSDIRVSP